MSCYMTSEIKAAVALHRDGVMIKDIASALGRNRDAVAKMLNYGGIKRGLGRPARRRPIDALCPDQTAMEQEAKLGTAMLLDAILRAGVRP
jgi:hypothetical protein